MFALTEQEERKMCTVAVISQDYGRELVAMSNCDGKNCELVSPLPRGKVSEMKCPLGRGLIKFAHSQQVIISGIDVQ